MLEPLQVPFPTVQSILSVVFHPYCLPMDSHPISATLSSKFNTLTRKGLCSPGVCKVGSVSSVKAYMGT